MIIVGIIVLATVIWVITDYYLMLRAIKRRRRKGDRKW